MHWSLMEVLQVIFQVGLVIVPHIGYVVQCIVIHRTRSFDGYAPLVSLILLTSNTLRIFYYIGHRYLLALFIQAVVGVPVHGGLLWKILEVHWWELLHGQSAGVYNESDAVISDTPSEQASAEAAKVFSAPGSAGAKRDPTAESQDDAAPLPHTEGIPVQQAASSSDAHHTIGVVENVSTSQPRLSCIAAVTDPLLRFLFRIEDCLEACFLRHTGLQFLCTYLLAAVTSLLVILLYYVSISIFWEDAPVVVGYMALTIEALLVLPQILRNARRSSTKGLTVLLVLTWACGDVAKVVYFIYAKQSLPFIVCGCFQILLDIVVVAQFIFYRFIRKRDGELCVEGEGVADRRYREAAIMAL
ncbi:hypothetical protein JKF63_04257 [Porcisia hertigi]|uniref:PQ-loop repeat-containing protein n=1 Tax=Porcisia hertigi TaxID=2761500 RepID=A0A836INP9_9TRYP|nr:hypothetical protein JKF63_04257 [Porcisia hertigi]